MIIDTHVHVISADEKVYPLRVMTSLLPRPTQTPAPPLWFWEMPVTVEKLLQLMDEAGVEKAVLVQPVLAYSYDNSYATGSALRYPGKFASVGAIDMLEPGAMSRLSYWVSERGMSCLRLFTGRDASWIDDPRTFPVWEKAATFHIPVLISLQPAELPRVRRLLERFPEARVLLDHMANPPVVEGPPFEASKPLFELAEFPNLYLKFSTPNFDALSVKPGLTRDFFQRLVDSFGAERLMWGSNFPTTHNRSYKEMVDFARESLSFLGKEETYWLFEGTALKIWHKLAKA